MRFAYADPPYLGTAKRLYGDHSQAHVYDTIEGHQALIDSLIAEYPDGWALSMASINLRALLPLCPDDAHVCIWVKPFASFKPNVNPAYAWEPVILRGGRDQGRDVPTTRDWLAESITLQRGVAGAKPTAFVLWVLNLLGAEPRDHIDDLFPGSGAVQRAIDGWREGKTGNFQEPLFKEVVAA